MSVSAREKGDRRGALEGLAPIRDTSFPAAREETTASMRGVVATAQMVGKVPFGWASRKSSTDAIGMP